MHVASTDQGSTQPSNSVSYKELIRFYLPLGITPIMFASTHTIVQGALARLPAPEANLAVYTVVQALANAVKAPSLTALQTTVSLIQDRTSFKSVTPLIWSVCAFFTVCLSVLGFTPAGEWVLRNVIGLREPLQISLAYTGLRISVFLPLVETLRNSMQGLAIGLRATGVLPASTAVRVGTITLFCAWSVSAQQMEGIVVGTVAWAVGIGIEGVLVGSYLVYRFGSPLRAAGYLPHRNPSRVTPLGFLKFFAPLGIMMAITAWMPPVIQGGLARGPSPTETLAAFGVAWGLKTILTGPLQMLHQAPLVFVSGLDDPRLIKVRRFCLGIGVIMTAAMLAVSYTAIGPWLVGSLLGIPPSVTPIALQTCAALATFPIIATWRESYWGVLMREKRTGIIGTAKVANLGAVFAAVILVFGPLQGLLVVIHPSVAGALIFALGEALEAIVVWRHAHRPPPSVQAVSHPA